MEFLNVDRENELFKCEIDERMEKDFAIYVTTENSAYKHEVNALIMALDGLLNIAAWQELDDNNNIVWRLW